MTTENENATETAPATERPKPQMKSKWQCQQVTDFGGSKSAKLTAGYSGNQEDNEFSEATPSGTIEMAITAAGAMDFLKAGKKYFVYFEACED